MINKKKCDKFLEEEWDNTEWSYSRVSSFTQCPFSWYETYILGNRSSNFYAYVGTSYHEVMEDYYNFLLSGGSIDMDVVKDTLKEKLKRKFNNNPFRNKWARSQYTKLIDSIDNFKTFDGITHVERLIKWEIDDYKFRGFIDLDAGEHHYDWKSKWDESKYGNQQNLYLFAKEQVDGIKTKGFKIPQYKDKLSVKSVRRSQSNIDNAISWVRETIPVIKKSIQTYNFKKNPESKFFCTTLCGARNCEHR